VQLAIVSYHVPDAAGSAAGRITYAVVTGLLDLGHDIRLWAWQNHEPEIDLPAWCRWAPVPQANQVRVRARSLAAPRSDIVRASWPFPDDGWDANAVAIAEDVPSHAATHGFRHRIVQVHYLTALDEAALARRTAKGMQDRRAERRAARQAHLVLGYSERVAEGIGGVPVPAGYLLPDAPRPPVERPTAVVAADWRWPPNQWALDRLLRSWPTVRDSVTGARLLLAGLGLEAVGTTPGVDVLGPVADTAELLADAAVLPFPCPATSGPKVKVMEALAAGVAVVTTPAGVEGLDLPAGAGAALSDAAAEPEAFAKDIVGVLRDPAWAAALGMAGRRAMASGHTPAAAASARVAAVATKLGVR
jgi:glycosyltransferase involved in cell wall biosynthesis